MRRTTRYCALKTRQLDQRRGQRRRGMAPACRRCMLYSPCWAKRQQNRACARAAQTRRERRPRRLWRIPFPISAWRRLAPGMPLHIDFSAPAILKHLWREEAGKEKHGAGAKKIARGAASLARCLSCASASPFMHHTTFSPRAALTMASQGSTVPMVMDGILRALRGGRRRHLHSLMCLCSAYHLQAACRQLCLSALPHSGMPLYLGIFAACAARAGRAAAGSSLAQHISAPRAGERAGGCLGIGFGGGG